MAQLEAFRSKGLRGPSPTQLTVVESATYWLGVSSPHSIFHPCHDSLCRQWRPAQHLGDHPPPLFLSFTVMRPPETQFGINSSQGGTGVFHPGNLKGCQKSTLATICGQCRPRGVGSLQSYGLSTVLRAACSLPAPPTNRMFQASHPADREGLSGSAGVCPAVGTHNLDWWTSGQLLRPDPAPPSPWLNHWVLYVCTAELLWTGSSFKGLERRLWVQDRALEYLPPLRGGAAGGGVQRVWH